MFQRIYHAMLYAKWWNSALELGCKSQFEAGLLALCRAFSHIDKIRPKRDLPAEYYCLKASYLFCLKQFEESVPVYKKAFEVLEKPNKRDKNLYAYLMEYLTPYAREALIITNGDVSFIEKITDNIKKKPFDINKIPKYARKNFPIRLS